jgi:spermidine synthase
VREDPGLWFHDIVNPHLVQKHRVADIVYSARTPFQSLQIIRTNSFGHCLILDGKLQSSERDEFIYHEALVHPAMIAHGHPTTVFVAGGAEGATLREILKNRSVQKVVMVDIDQQAVEACHRFLPSLHQNLFEDDRARTYYEDARHYLSGTSERFDVVVLDLTDPMEEGLAHLLYAEEFYRIVEDRLRPGGVLCTQAGSCNWGEMDTYLTVGNTLRSVFPVVSQYRAHVPSFGGEWGFVFASDGQVSDPVLLPPKEIDRRLSSAVCDRLRFYDGTTHQGMFHLPRYLRPQTRGRRKATAPRPSEAQS